MRIRAGSLSWLLGASLAVAGIPKDQPAFTRYVAERLDHRAPQDVRAQVVEPLTLRFGDLTLNLDRIYAFCVANETRCTDEVDRYIGGALETFQEQHAPAKPEFLRLVLRSESYVNELQKSFEADTRLQPRPFVAGLLMVPVLDTPKTIRLLNARDVQSLGLSLDQIFEIAGANTRRALVARAEAAPAAGRGQIGPLTGDNYESSLLLYPDYWASLAARQNGVLVASVPAKDVILYAGEDTPQALDALRAMTRDVMAHSAGPLSAVVLRWEDGAWRVVP